MEIKQKVNIHNRLMSMENRLDAKILLDQMWTRLRVFFIWFGIGTENYLLTKTAVTEETIKALPLSSWKRKIVLNPEEFVGVTEVGIASVQQPSHPCNA